jgi:uncharacterized protein (DUF1015 family)
MAEIHPFCGVRYDEQKAGSLELLVAPPYDVISEQDQEELYQLSPYNIVRLILGKDTPGDNAHDNKYLRAARDLNDWQKEGVLCQDKNRSLYVYEHEFTLPSGERKTRRGFMGRVRLERFESGQIRPHENIYQAPLEDRLQLLRACRANLSPVFAAYDDPHKTIDQFLGTDKAPVFDLMDSQQQRHRIYLLEDPQKIAGIQQAMRQMELFIADGHHRYTTALNYLEEQKRQNPDLSPDAPVNFIMMMFVNLFDENLTILPVHRLIKHNIEVEKDFLLRSLENDFLIESFHDHSPENLSRCVSNGGGDYYHFGLILPGNKFFVLTLKDSEGNRVLREKIGELDVTVLHTRIVERILGIPPTDPEKEHVLFTPDVAAAWKGVQESRYRMALLVNPTRVEDVKAVACAGGRMPQKSTYFFPKPLCGLVMHKFDE